MKVHNFLSLGFIISTALLGQQPNAATTATVPAGVATIHRHTVAPDNVYHHIITVVPFTGSGTYKDPKRPMYLPAALAAASDRTGILGFTFQPSDDGKFAIVEYVAANKSAFNQIYADKTLTVFEKGKDQKAAVEAAMQKYRKSFSLDTFGVVVR